MAGLHPDVRFGSTRWSLVREAGGTGNDARAALGDLSEAYWYPLYALARRRGASPEDAQDHVQSFFADLLVRDVLERADPGRGRFRSFLCTAFLNFAANAHARATAQKRGGSVRHLPLDFEDGEARYQLEPEGGLTAERLYERRFALVLVHRALARLAAGERSGAPARAERFELLRDYVELGAGPPHRITAERLGLSETAVKVAIHRLRARFRDALRVEVADTLAAGADVDAELRVLLQAVSGA